MGHNANGPNTFWPDNTETECYLSSEHSMADLWNLILNKWPGIRMEEITIKADAIQTSELFDREDFCNCHDFLHITALKEYFERIKKEAEEKTK